MRPWPQPRSSDSLTFDLTDQLEQRGGAEVDLGGRTACVTHSSYQDATAIVATSERKCAAVDMGCEQPDVALEEVGRRTGVSSPSDARSGRSRFYTGGDCERANNARFQTSGTMDMRRAITREYPEIRVEARTMTARPTAGGLSAACETDHLEGWRQRACQHHPFAASRDQGSAAASAQHRRTDSEQAEAAEHRASLPGSGSRSSSISFVATKPSKPGDCAATLRNG